ncbi:MAG: DUF1559 domain-containing protein, partial [Planctomycetia bacterium]|nr:DUF1559 domain-containing protein [Planctomycetia bacterium]
MAENSAGKWFVRLGISSVVGAVAALVWFGVREGLESSHRKSCRVNLQQIAAALQAYHEQYKSFPPAHVLGPDGEPYRSWRVVLLPFLDEQNLYDQYRFDEPWNGPHNRTLIEQIPKLYACPSATGQKPGTTNYLAVVGRGTCWPEQYSIRYEDIHDGTSNTVQLVESSNSSVQWLEPRDIAYREAQSHGKPAGHPTPSSKHLSATNANSQGGFHVTLADGSVKFLNHQIDPKIFRSLLSINGGRALARVDWPALDLPEPLELPPSRPAEEFPSTDVLPYPTGPITRGRNYVYCATFEIAWDEARKALGGGPIVLEGDPPLAQMLNSHSFDRRNLDPNSYLARGGPGSSEARTQIREELAAKFPKSEPRSLNQIQGERWLLLYAYFLKSLRFETEFELLPKPLMFLAPGREKPVVGFGIAHLDDSIAQGEHLQVQVRILDYKSDDDFVVQLLP